MAVAEKKANKSPNVKGGSKGGTRFPRLDLKEALGYSKKLVSKTFNGPQPEMTVLVGVFGNKGPHGAVRASALKQYGLMDGDAKGYFASDLAKKIETVVPEEKAEPIRKAFLTSKLFKQMYDTLQPDRVTRAKVRQAASTGGVHRESLEACIGHFIEGAAHAGLGAKIDDGIDLSQSSSVPPLPPDDVEVDTEDGAPDNGVLLSEATIKTPGSKTTADSNESEKHDSERGALTRSDKPLVTLSLTVDATSDPEKLEKQLKLLRQFGVI